MRINRNNALRLWEECYGTSSLWEKDFHGNLMYKDVYDDDEAWAYPNGYSYMLGRSTNSFWPPVCNKVYCGWNIHHILPKANGGTDEKGNLICTNIATNREAEDKTTFWIGDYNYQVQRVGTRKHEIVRLNQNAMKWVFPIQRFTNGLRWGSTAPYVRQYGNGL